MIRVDPSPILFYFYFFYSIRVGPSRSELIRPRMAVRVDPVRLLYLPFKDDFISSCRFADMNLKFKRCLIFQLKELCKVWMKA